MKKIVILGAGISGLAAAWFLKKKFKDSIEVTILEKSSRVGGWIKTTREKEFLFECGPRGFRPKGKGEITLELVKELGLESQLIAANKQTRKRYIYLKGKLRPFSLGFLLRQKFFSGCFHDFFCQKTVEEDETIAHFISRRFNRRLAENLIDPLVKGVFAGEAQRLSMRSCFPLLWAFEQNNGSVVRGFFSRRKTKKQKKETALYSFQQGMEMLPKALAEKLDARICLSTEVNSLEEIEADHVISALPTYALAHILNKEDPLEFATLSTVSFGWHGEHLRKRGYGFLVPSKEKAQILGMTWDSEIFSEQNVGKQTRVCVKICGEHSEEELYNRALHSLSHYLEIDESPSVCSIHTSRRAIPQYLLNHHKRISLFKETLPPNVSVIGNCFAGVAINDCIAGAQAISENISFAS